MNLWWNAEQKICKCVWSVQPRATVYITDLELKHLLILFCCLHYSYTVCSGVRMCCVTYEYSVLNRLSDCEFCVHRWQSAWISAELAILSDFYCHLEHACNASHVSVSVLLRVAFRVSTNPVVPIFVHCRVMCHTAVQLVFVPVHLASVHHHLGAICTIYCRQIQCI